jgi:hypothetical protein
MKVDWAHLAAHAADWSVPVEGLLQRAEQLLDSVGETPEARVWVAEAPVGRSRLVALGPGQRSWWGLRPGRSTWSHLTHGEGRPTCSCTAWGVREGGALRLLTLHPGAPAPREIHDPQISAEELPASLAFWSRHALATGDTPPAEPRPAPTERGVFLNLSNHPSATWGEEQRRGPLALAERLVDHPFPVVPPAADGAELARLVQATLAGLPERLVGAMVQGEYVVSALLVQALQARAVPCFVATTERSVQVGPDGAVSRRFGFVAWRAWPALGPGAR